MSLNRFLGLISGEDACNEIDSSDSVLTRADLAWSISGWRMTDEVVMLKGKRLLVTVPGGPYNWLLDWNDFGEGQSSVLQGRPVRDENLFEVEFRNDLMDSPLADDWNDGVELTVRVVMVVVTVTVDDRTNDWVRVRVKLMRAMAMVVIDWQVGNGGKRMTQQWDCPETDYADADAGADGPGDFDDLWR
ncbi:hypothetical protein BY996DRAFT_6565870 [Phakopsora pachyrhizi]|nr:hypothetical protein BY996DRAFT_6565870 [Phakopsora pachyrhizi]